uniref:Neural cell adhesion molecule 2 n=1 Tax=Denticeps clupeoides TaxID=299321 RepID=A0AAY4AD18_9TELE
MSPAPKVLLLLAALLCASEAVLQVSISLNKVELSVGESKFFTCTVIGEPVSLLTWFNPQGERIISSQRVVLHQEGIRSRLTIYNAVVEDAGIYRCQAADATGQSQEATVVLEIYQKLTFREVQSPQEFRQAEDAEVVCDVISSPVPAVSWFYKNKEILSEPNDRFQVLPNNNLQILKVSKSDEGVYRCEARVEARGEIDFRDIAVVVNVLSVPQKSFNATADYQESVTFTCITAGSPEPQVTWHRKGHQIENSDHHALTSLGGGRSTLTVRNIQQGDGGPYTCRATNKAGLLESELLLKVFGEAGYGRVWQLTGVSAGSEVIAASPTSLCLFISMDSDGRVEVRGRYGKSTLTINGVQLSDRGRFDCEAQSRIGGHQKSMYLDIEYAPKFHSNHTIFYSWEGNPVNISCEVMSNPTATILWRRERYTISSEGTANSRVHSTQGRSLLEVTPTSDRDFGRYNCTARNNIGARYQEFILALADVPSNPYSVRLTSVSQRIATVTFMKPDSHGGVPIGHYVVSFKDPNSQEWRTVKSHAVVVLSNLEPNTTYEVRVAAVNGKGQGEFSHTESFQTLPIREPSPPAVNGQRGVGKAYRLGLVKQDDGGMPIVEYIVKYKTVSSTALPLQWNTRYTVEITARNIKGLSEPAYFQFLMPQKPDITADSLFSGMSLGTVVGLAVAAVLLLLVLLDVSCFFMRQCGVLMCLSRRLCSRKSATSSKSKDLEEGKAAYLGDGSKEPIVEMRTEEERITHPEDGSPVNEPTETTPLTEPEKLPLKEENGKDILKPDMIEIKVHSENSLHTKGDDSKA